MEPYRLRVKLGEHEFEAEGTEESVRTQFEKFTSLITLVPAKPLVPTKDDKVQSGGQAEAPASSDLLLVFDHDEKKGIVSLKRRPMGEEANSEAFLLSLLGYKRLASRDEVVVTDLKASLEKSGVTFKRVDRLAEPCMRQRWVLKGGKGKGGKYSLTNTGIERAQQVLQEMLSQLK